MAALHLGQELWEALTGYIVHACFLVLFSNGLGRSYGMRLKEYRREGFTPREEGLMRFSRGVDKGSRGGRRYHVIDMRWSNSVGCEGQEDKFLFLLCRDPESGSHFARGCWVSSGKGGFGGGYGSRRNAFSGSALLSLVLTALVA